MALSKEEIERRRGNQTKSDSGGGFDSDYLRWHGKQAGDVELFQHLGEKVRQVYRHSYRVPVLLAANPEKELPERKVLSFRNFRCWNTDRWWKRFRLDRYESLGQFRGPIACPFCSLVRHVEREYPEEPVFSWGRGCSDREGRMLPVTEVTGFDAAGLTKSKTAYERDLTASGRFVQLVVPVAFDGEDCDEPQVKIAIEGYGLYKAHDEEIARALRDYGQDMADPVVGPAVYRWSYDPAGIASAKYSVRFIERRHGKLPVEFVRAFEQAPPADVLATLNEDVLAYGNREQLAEDLRLILAGGVQIDFDEAFGSGQPPGAVAMSSAERAARRDAKKGGAGSQDPAARSAPAKTAARRGAPAPEPDPDAPPCDNCGTPWPPGLRYCPGRESKGCNFLDEAVPESKGKEREPGSDDGDGDPAWLS